MYRVKCFGPFYHKTVFGFGVLLFLFAICYSYKKAPLFQCKLFCLFRVFQTSKSTISPIN